MERDNGRAVLAAPLQRLPKKAEAPKPSMTQFEARALVARMVVIWGDWRLTTTEARDAYVAEFWPEFAFTTKAVVDLALSRLKGRTDRRGWPEIGEIKRAIVEGAGPRETLPVFREAPLPPLTPSEIAQREQIVARAKAAVREGRLPFTPALDYSVPGELERVVKKAPLPDREAERDSVARIRASLARDRP